MKCWMMKLIWYLPTWGQKLIVKELQPFLFEKFDLGHPVQFIAMKLSHIDQIAKLFLDAKTFV